MSTSRIIILYTIIFLHTLSFAQQFEWGKSQEIIYDLNPEFLNYITATDNLGNVYFAGLKASQEVYLQNAYGDSFFIKYTSDGDELFSLIFSGAAIIKNMTTDSENNILIIGMNRSDIDFGNNHQLQYTGEGTNTFLAKLTENGDVLWLKNLTAVYDFPSAIRAIKTDSDNNIYIAWDDNQNARTIIKKLNPAGNDLMEIIQSGVPFISSLDVNDAGEIAVAGSCAAANAQFAGVPFVPGFTTSAYVAKYTPAGAVEWVQFVEDANCQLPQISFCPQGNIYFSGKLSDAFLFGTLQTDGPSLVYDFFLAKISSTGEFVWVQEVPDVETGDATTGKLTHLGTDPAGNAYITGFTRNNIEWNNDWQTEVTARGLLVLSYNPDGQLRWAKAASGALDGQSVAVHSSESMFVAGTAFGFVQMDDFMITSPSFYFPFLARMTTIPTKISEKYTTDQILISPNPIAEKATITLKGGHQKISRIAIYDINGKNVFSMEEINDTKTVVCSNNLRKGFYWIKITTSRGGLITEKLVIQ